MQLETFRGRATPRVLESIRDALGDDAWVVSSRVTSGGSGGVELVAAPGAALRDLALSLEPGEPTWTSRRTADERPRIVALVGPTGAGKTTTAAKLAVQRAAYGHRRPGFLCLDTERAAAVEQLGMYAAAADIPLAVCHNFDMLVPALRTLGACDVLIVDTPGGPPLDPSAEWARMLRRLRPDEVHLALPATLSTEAVRHLVGAYRTLAPTHVVPTKLDEAPSKMAGALVVLESDLACRWITDGRRITTGLSNARAALSGPLGLAPTRRPESVAQAAQASSTPRVA